MKADGFLPDTVHRPKWWLTISNDPKRVFQAAFVALKTGGRR